MGAQEPDMTQKGSEKEELATNLPWLAVVGTTASGKSELALRLAEELDGEIVNSDAYQFYRGMDIGTAKVTEAEQRRVPHHLIDVLDPHEEMSVAKFQNWARQAGDTIRARGKVPILAGGSGLYARAVLDDLQFPGTDPQLRAAREADLETRGVEALYAELSEKDPTAAAAMEPRNARRIVRALEVIDLTGKPFSATMPKREYLAPAVQVALEWPRPTLQERIRLRSVDMIRQGLIDETLALLDRGLADGVTARRALGYAQIIKALPGPLDPDALAAEISQVTWRYARRQLSWYRPDNRVHWLDGETGPDQVVARSLEIYDQLRILKT